MICSSYGECAIWDINSGECLKILEYDKSIKNFVFMNDNILIYKTYNAITITPITLFPGELDIFRLVINPYNLAWHIEHEVMNYFRC